jgi:molybdopterin converting factor small subunit
MQYVEIFDPQDCPHPLTPSPIKGEGEQESLAPLSPSGRGAGGEGGTVRNAGYAPYLDYRPLEEAEKPLAESVLSSLGLRDDIESKATSYAIAHLVSNHLQEVRERKEELIEKTVRAVKDRLTKEINYWDQRAADLRLQEQAGKPNAKLNSAKAQQRADELAARLQKRLSELEQERKFSPMPPVVIGGALVVPIGLLQRLQGKREAATSTFARETKRVELAAMAAVMAAERALGYEPRDVSDRKCGYDIESSAPLDRPGRGAEGEGLRLIEVKGRIEGAETVTVTKNEILAALNKPDNFILALVQVPVDRNFPEGDAFAVRESGGDYQVQDKGCILRYVKKPFQPPDFRSCSVNYPWKDLWNDGYDPRRTTP